MEEKMETKKAITAVIRNMIGVALYFIGYFILIVFLKDTIAFFWIKGYYPQIACSSTKAISDIILMAIAFIALKTMGFSYNPFHSRKGVV
jgi:hypothetical protein